MKYVILMALMLQSYGALAAEKAKTQKAVKATTTTTTERTPASVTPAASDVETKGDVDSMLGEMQSALENSDNAMDSSPE